MRLQLMVALLLVSSCVPLTPDADDLCPLGESLRAIVSAKADDVLKLRGVPLNALEAFFILRTDGHRLTYERSGLEKTPDYELFFSCDGEFLSLDELEKGVLYD